MNFLWRSIPLPSLWNMPPIRLQDMNTWVSSSLYLVKSIFNNILQIRHSDPDLGFTLLSTDMDPEAMKLTKRNFDYAFHRH